MKIGESQTPEANVSAAASPKKGDVDESQADDAGNIGAPQDDSDT